VLLGVHLTDTGDQKLLCRLLCLILNPLVVGLTQLGQSLERINVASVLVCIVIQLQTVGPAGLVQVEKHFLLALILAIVDGNRIIVLIKAAHLSNHARWFEVANVRSGLARLCAHHHHLTVDATESVNHDLTLHGLDGVHNNGDSTSLQGFLLSLCLNIGAR
jgi:hypothetical protein